MQKRELTYQALNHSCIKASQFLTVLLKAVYYLCCYFIIRIKGFSHKSAVWAISGRGGK